MVQRCEPSEDVSACDCVYIPQPSGAQSAARPVHLYGCERSVKLTLTLRGREVKVLYDEERVELKLHS